MVKWSGELYVPCAENVVVPCRHGLRMRMQLEVWADGRAGNPDYMLDSCEL